MVTSSKLFPIYRSVDKEVQTTTSRLLPMNHASSPPKNPRGQGNVLQEANKKLSCDCGQWKRRYRNLVRKIKEIVPLSWQVPSVPSRVGNVRL